MGDILDIRYSELRFTVRLISDSELPRFKTSAIRGGMGDMLLDEYCIREKIRKENGNKCDSCDYLDECIVQRIMYSKMDIEPAFMSSGNSIGYIVECLDSREQFEAGDTFEFKLILFGKNCFYLSQYLSAIYRLGMNGIGKDHAQFQVISVRNMRIENILEENRVYKDKYRIDTINEYVEWRRKSLSNNDQIHIRIKTPLSIKKMGKQLSEIDIEAFIDNLNRRLYSLNCFEGNDHPELLEKKNNYPVMLDSESRTVSIPRYSFRKNQKIFLSGIYGSVDLDLENVENYSELIRRLLAGELIHVGSNTSFGFGGYELTEVR